MSTQPANPADYNTAKAQKSLYDADRRKPRKNFPPKSLKPEQRETIVRFLIDKREEAVNMRLHWVEMQRSGPVDGGDAAITYYKLAEKIMHDLIRCLEPRTK